MEPDLAAAAFWTSPRGAEALEAARETRGDEPLSRRAALDRRFTGEEARLALAQDDLRARGAAKTPFADRLLFTGDALEQATTAAVAAERARRFEPFSTVADLGAGIGLDAIALAQAGRRVVAVERDPVRAALLAHNAAAAGFLDRVTVVSQDFLAESPAADAAFLDPDRRPGGRRYRDPDLFEPPPPAWPSLAERYGHLLVKLAPATEPDQHRGSGLEWVSERGAMKEARLGFGALAIPAPRRALMLPEGTVLSGSGRPWPDARAPVAGDLVLDPDPAVVLAGLVGEAALEAEAAPVHPRIAYLLAPRPAPWAHAVLVLEVASAAPRAIQAWLDANEVGDLTIRSRGVSDPPEAWRKRLAPRGGRRGTLVLTRGPDDRYLALLGEEVSGLAGGGAGMPGRAGGMP